MRIIFHSEWEMSPNYRTEEECVEQAAQWLYEMLAEGGTPEYEVIYDCTQPVLPSLEKYV